MRKNGKGSESGKGRKGKPNGAKSGGLLPRGKGRRKGGKDGTSGDGRKRGKGSGSTGRGGGLPSWLGGKGKPAKKKQKYGPCGPGGTGRGGTKSATSPDGLNPPPYVVVGAVQGDFGQRSAFAVVERVQRDGATPIRVAI